MKPVLNTSLLRSRLKLKNWAAESTLRAHHPQAMAQLEAAGVHPGSLRAHAAKLLSAGVVAGSLMLTSPNSLPVGASLPSATQSAPAVPSNLHKTITDLITSLTPQNYGHLDPVSESKISSFLHQTYGIHASAELEGNRLNHSWGLIGAEQHLPRYPGDTASQHGAYERSGITPGRGAWGYFAYSQADLTPDLMAKEKYYFAVQTLYLPDWDTQLPYLRDWYKYRKMVAINPINGKAIVGVVADAGPAQFTGKHFGGSPEIMDYLELNIGQQKGPVLMYFVDDPGDQVPLGPLEYNLERPPLLVSG